MAKKRKFRLKPQNNERANWAQDALEGFAEDLGLVRSGDYKEDPTIALHDLVCDLWHLAQREGWDMAKVLENAKKTYDEEVLDP